MCESGCEQIWIEQIAAVNAAGRKAESLRCKFSELSFFFRRKNAYLPNLNCVCVEIRSWQSTGCLRVALRPEAGETHLSGGEVLLNAKEKPKNVMKISGLKRWRSQTCWLGPCWNRSYGSIILPLSSSSTWRKQNVPSLSRKTLSPARKPNSKLNPLIHQMFLQCFLSIHCPE